MKLRLSTDGNGNHQVSVCIPGKVMLAGEYTVLRGGLALAATVNRFLTVSAASNVSAPDLATDWPTDAKVSAPESAAHGATAGFGVTSDLWTNPCFVPVGTDPSSLVQTPLLAAVNFGMQRYGLTSGRIHVVSELDTSFGLGSSSAVRLGVLLALRRLSPKSYEQHAQGAFITPTYARPNADWQAAVDAFKLQRQAQTFASGYDVATQLHGGLLCFTPPPLNSDPAWPIGLNAASITQQQNLSACMHLFVGGKGAPTSIVMNDTIQWLDMHERWPLLQDLTADLVTTLLATLDAWHHDAGARGQLLAAVGRSRAGLFGSPHFPGALAKALAALPGCDQTWSFKTTGAGGEDALLLVGATTDLGDAKTLLASQGWTELTVNFEQQGTRVQWH